MRGQEGARLYMLDVPYLVVVEAKRSTTLGATESEAELLGQLRVLMMKQYSRIVEMADN
jgi:hypothetical protein